VGEPSWEKVPPRKQTHLHRRLQLLGETVESGQVWDIVQAIRASRNLIGAENHIRIHANGTMAVNALYASIFSDDLDQLRLDEPPVSHRNGPTYLNILRNTDIPEVALLASQRAEVQIKAADPDDWEPMRDAAVALGLAEKIQILPSRSEAAVGSATDEVRAAN
jgi:hypothetical protein